jgi:hypothetical protein
MSAILKASRLAQAVRQALAQRQADQVVTAA